jgi:hypothetical protein
MSPQPANNEQASAQAGGAVSGQFPNYKTGDIIIILSSEHEYRLHSSLLKLHSPFFYTACTPANSSIRSTGDGSEIKWRFEWLPVAGSENGKLFLVVSSRSPLQDEPFLSSISDCLEDITRLFSFLMGTLS